MQPSSAQFSAQCPKRLQHPAHHAPRRQQHPAHHAPKRLQPRPQCPGTRSIRPTAPQAPTTRGLRQMPAVCRTTLRLAPWHGPLLHIMYQAPTRQLPAVPATRMSGAHNPPRLYTPGARDFPLMCTSVAPDPFAHLHPGRLRLFMRRAVRPKRPHIPRGLAFFDSVPGECPSNPQGITTLVRQSLDQGFFSRCPNPYPPRSLPHRSRR